MAPSLPSALQASVSGLSGPAHPRRHLGQGCPYPTRGRPVRALSCPDPQRQPVPGTSLIPKDRDPWWPQPSPLDQFSGQFMQPPTRMPAVCSPCAPNGGLTLGGPWRWVTSRLGSGGSSLGGEVVPSSENCWVYRERQVTAVTPQLPDSHGAGVGSCSPHHPELGTVDVQSDLAMCGGGGFPLPQREVCTGAQTCQPLLQFLGRAPRAILSRAKPRGVPPTNPL